MSVGSEGTCVCRTYSLPNFYCFHCIMVPYFKKLQAACGIADFFYGLYAHSSASGQQKFDILYLQFGRNTLYPEEIPDSAFSPLDSKNHLCTCSCYGHLLSHWQCVRHSPFPNTLPTRFNCYVSLTEDII